MSRRRWKSGDVPVAVERVPSMLSLEEKQYLRWLTAEAYEGWGAVVDLGPWLGSSSAALADGLEGAKYNASVHCFDLFRWDRSYMEAISKQNLETGADFLPLFHSLVEPWGSRIEATRCDLLNATWRGGAIEILFVDAAKSWDLLNAILKAFAAFLEPGRSRVVLQDFRHYHTYFLPLVFDGNPALWQERESVADGTTVTFTPLCGPMDYPLYSEENFAFDIVDSIFDRRISAGAGRSRYDMQLGLLYLAFLRRETSCFDRIRQDIFQKDSAHVKESEGRDFSRAWLALESGHLTSARSIAEQSLEHNAASPEALLVLGRVAQESGNDKAAKQLLNQALEGLYKRFLNVADWDSFESGDLATAKGVAEESIRKHGPTAEAYFLLGRVAQELRRYDEAEQTFAHALEIDPYHRHSLEFHDKLVLFRGFAAFEEGDHAAAGALLAEFEQRHGPTSESRFLSGRIAQIRGHFEEAEQAFEAALAIDPAHSFSQAFLAELKAEP